jgi:hypothetical protein
MSTSMIMPVLACIMAPQLVLGGQAVGGSRPDQKQDAVAAVEITMGSGTPFYLPVLSRPALPISPEKKATAVLPLAGLKGATAYALKVAPQPEGQNVAIEVWAITEKYDGILSCDLLKDLQQERVARYTSRAGGEPIAVTEASRFGAPPLTIRVLPKLESATAARAQAGPESDPGCCSCAATKCCPRPGYCLDCSVCGLCCN